MGTIGDMLVAADCSSHQDLPVVTTSGRQAQSLLLLPLPLLHTGYQSSRKRTFLRCGVPTGKMLAVLTVVAMSSAGLDSLSCFLGVLLS